ncbi:retrovirus-related pol polyprotein from transposon TNT 1-94 [Tanacetum coccineum]
MEDFFTLKGKIITSTVNLEKKSHSECSNGDMHVFIHSGNPDQKTVSKFNFLYDSQEQEGSTLGTTSFDRVGSPKAGIYTELTGNRGVPDGSSFRNPKSKNLFGNDHIAKIMGYGDYQIKNVIISWVYYVEGLGHNLFSVGQFCDSDLENNEELIRIKGKKYILVIVDDYLRFTWVKFLRSKDETPKFVIKFLKVIQVRLNTSVRSIRTDNGTEFVNQTLKSYYEDVGISHQTSALLIFVGKGCCNKLDIPKNCHWIRNDHINKTPYELLHDRKPYLKYLHVFGALCYPTNDSEDLDGARGGNYENYHVDFNELIAMALLNKAVKDPQHLNNLKNLKIISSKTRCRILHLQHLMFHQQRMIGFVVPTNVLLWVPTGRIFAICGKLTASSNTENKSDKSVCDNASTSNPSKPSSKGFSNSTSLLGRRTKVAKSVVQIVLWYLDSGCSKHMTGQRSQLINFVEKFLGTIRFGNDHIAKIMGYDDYQIKNVIISWVYYVEGLGHNLFSVGQFCDSDLEDETPEFVIKFLKMIQVRLNTSVRSIHTDNGTEFVNQTLKSYYEDVGISHQTSVAHTLQQNGVVERQNRTLVKDVRTMLIFSKALLYLKPDLKYLPVFGALSYPTNDSEDLGKLKPKADIGIFIGYTPAKKTFRIYNRRTRQFMKTIHVDFNELIAMASEQSSSGPALYEITTEIISSRLVQNPPSTTPYVPPTKNDWILCGLIYQLRIPTVSLGPKSPLKLVDEPSDEGVPVEDPAHTDEEADLQRALELSLKEQAERTQGPARPVVLREPDSGKYQPLPEVQGKGKEKVVDEQAAHDLLTLQTPTKKSPVDQFIFQRRPPMHTEPTGHADSPSLDAELPLTDSETESDEEVPVINAGDQDEGQAGPNPGIQDEGQAGSNPGDAAESQPQPSHGVHAGPNREHMDLEATDASSQQKPEQMDEEFTTTAYPNVQENLKLPTEDQVILEEPASSTGTLSSLQNLEKDLSFTDQFFMEKPHEEESGKTNAETEVSWNNIWWINNLALEERLDKQGTQLYNLENLNIPHKVSQAVDEIVTDAVDWAMQAPLRARFRDLPTVDMKEILQQRMFEDNSYKAHEAHNDLYEALQKSLELDYSNQHLADQEEAPKKKRKKRATPITPFGSPPSPPPPLHPSAGASSTPGISGTSGSSQLLPPPPLPSTGASGSAQQVGSEAPSSSKPAASTYQSMAWTTSDTRFESTNFMAA